MKRNILSLISLAVIYACLFIAANANELPLDLKEQSKKAQRNEQTPAAKLAIVKLAPSTILINGHLSEPQWQQASITKSFTLPWRDFLPQKTQFSTFIDDNNLYFAFIVNDTDVVLSNDFIDENTVANEDRVEIFISKSIDLSQYYCIEMDAKGRVLDYLAKSYRQFDSSWQLSGLEVASKITPQGYIIEGKFPIASLLAMGITEDTFHLGLFRADYHHQKSAQGKTISDDIQWISWVDPQISSPDFHIPQVFIPVKLAQHPRF